MSSYGSAVTRALERGNMTPAEIALEAGVTEPTVREYIRYLEQCIPPKVAIVGMERSEKTTRLVPIYSLSLPAQEAA